MKRKARWGSYRMELRGDRRFLKKRHSARKTTKVEAQTVKRNPSNEVKEKYTDKEVMVIDDQHSS